MTIQAQGSFSPRLFGGLVAVSQSMNGIVWPVVDELCKHVHANANEA